MTASTTRLATAILAATALLVGGYAELAPRTFYDRFPISSHPWIAPTGAYDEHLIRDVGSAYLALFVLSGWGLLRRSRETTVLTGAVWATFSIPHLAFHLAHLDEFRTADRIGNVVTLGGTVVLSLMLLVPWPQPARRPALREASR